jgi:hypothetical protein
MRIGNQVYTREDILRRVGNLSQIGGTRRYTLAQGRAKGVAAIDIDTGAGLHCTVLPDRSMDISATTYKGINLVYRTPNGEVHPSYYEPEGGGWLRTFFGGLVTTCGLTHLGAPGKDGDELLGVHGRASTTPATIINDLSRWEGDEYIVEIAGVMDDAVLFGDKLRQTRTIATKLGARSLVIRDVVRNVGYKPSPFTILYHINPGFPLLDAASRVIVSAAKSTPYDDISAGGMAEMLTNAPPTPGWREQNFLHTLCSDSKGYGWAALVNPGLGGGLGLAVRVKADALPYVSHWKMVGEGDYVVALEPCNVPCLNRAELRREGVLPFLQPGEERTMEVELGVLEGDEEITSFERMARSVTAAKEAT